MSEQLSAPTVALMSPGDMGEAVGRLLRQHGVRVISALHGRSPRTRALAAEAGIEEVTDDVEMIKTADILLSIVAPAEAEGLARRLALAIEQAGGDILYADCNAIAPTTVQRLAAVIEPTGAHFVDGGIIGPPPRPDSRATRLYVSGPKAARLAVLSGFGLDVRAIGDQVGDASAIKMCYAALNKGTIALMTGVSVMAERLGVSEPFGKELALSQEAVLGRMHRQVPGMVPKAHRWIGEMEEIAETFDKVDLTPAVFEGIADIYRLVAEKPIASASPEDWRKLDPGYQKVIEALSAK
ncbi:MAG: DUF1932 domain-containing protein [Geminicoccaceae bacterium]